MNVGNIIVITGGISGHTNKMFKIRKKGNNSIFIELHGVYWEVDESDELPNGFYEESPNIRLATQREIDGYNQGIRNINNVSKIHVDEFLAKDTNKAVLIKTKEQLLEVSNRANRPYYRTNNYIHEALEKASVVLYLDHNGWDKVGHLYSNRIIVYNFEDIDFEPRFVLPKKWCVKPGRHIWEWYKGCMDKGNPHGWSFGLSHYRYIYSGGQVAGYFHYPVRPIDGWHWDKDKDSDYTEITLEQFNKYVVNKGIEEVTKVEQPKPEIHILGEKVEFIKKSVQFGDITLTLKDLEAIKRVNKLCEEQDIDLEFAKGATYINNDNSSQNEITGKIETIIKQLK